MTDLREQLRGLWLPLVTPFRNGELDETSLRRMVRHYADGPIDGLILAATSGEGMSLGMSELERLVAIIRARYRPAGATSRSASGCRARARTRCCDALDETAAWPIDGYLIASPYYTRPSQRGLLRHFTDLADHASWPIALYNIPYRCAVGIDNDTLLELAQHPNIIGLKDCCADRAQSIDLLAPPPRRLPRADRRGRAVPQRPDRRRRRRDPALRPCRDRSLRRSADAVVGGQPGGAAAQWQEVAELTRLLFVEPSPAPAKHWLARIGLIDSAEVRLPMVEVGAELAARRLDRGESRAAQPRTLQRSA